MAPSRAAPVSFDLHAVRVGSFVVQAGALLDVPLARDPRLRVDVGRSKASVEMSLPATRGIRRSSHRLARLEYGDETVQWFQLEPDGDPAKIGTNHSALVLRLASPPALTAGRVDVPPEASDEADFHIKKNRRMSSSKPFVAWGTAGKASDFTAGEASRTATAFLCFRDAEAAARASAALERAWPGKKKTGATRKTRPSRRRATWSSRAKFLKTKITPIRDGSGSARVRTGACTSRLGSGTRRTGRTIPGS